MIKPDDLKCSVICGGTAPAIHGVYFILANNAKIAWLGASVDVYHRYSENRVKLELGTHGCKQLQDAHNNGDILEFRFKEGANVKDVRKELKDGGIKVYSRGCANDKKIERKRNRRIYAKSLKTGEILYWDNIILAVLDGYTNASWAVKGQYNPSRKQPNGSNVYNGFEWGYADA